VGATARAAPAAIRRRRARVAARPAPRWNEPDQRAPPGAGGSLGTGRRERRRRRRRRWWATGAGGADALPARPAILNAMPARQRLLHGQVARPRRRHPHRQITREHIWTRAVLHEGLMALYALDAQARYYQLRRDLGDQPRLGPQQRHRPPPAPTISAPARPNLDLYKIDAQASASPPFKSASTPGADGRGSLAWSWSTRSRWRCRSTRARRHDRSTTYFDKMYAYYSTPRTPRAETASTQDGAPVVARTRTSIHPTSSPTVRIATWSRGNGWVYAALVRVPRHPAGDRPAPRPNTWRTPGHVGRAAPGPAQRWFLERELARSHGLWRQELTGTALFTYGMAWGVRTGNLPSATYRPIVVSAWNAMVTDSLQPAASSAGCRAPASSRRNGSP